MTGAIIFGCLTFTFAGLAILQLITRRRITFYGTTDKRDDPKRYWSSVYGSVAVTLGCLYLIREFINGTF